MHECPGLFAGVRVHAQVFVDEFVGVLRHDRQDGLTSAQREEVLTAEQ